jgi:hypothetical protein
MHVKFKKFKNTNPPFFPLAINETVFVATGHDRRLAEFHATEFDFATNK